MITGETTLSTGQVFLELSLEQEKHDFDMELDENMNSNNFSEKSPQDKSTFDPYCQDVPYASLGQLDDLTFNTTSANVVYTPANSTTRLIMKKAFLDLSREQAKDNFDLALDGNYVLARLGPRLVYSVRLAKNIANCCCTEVQTRQIFLIPLKLLALRRLLLLLFYLE
ncbi:hypothetical protein Y1Q_0016342 [Alligator mississippiensis]|uniref:Uncharacterized protein n=1 Tax=Alligator mississippiensis TaxID=8496 RepID=A0A151N298_ALLMI|nr:hypothetical protein Y1Q_0016342 [Alligator mississippiensis]